MTADRVTYLKAWLAKLEVTIKDKETRDYLLRLAKNWLEDVERKVAPGVEAVLPIIEQELQRVQDAVNKYGPNIQLRGG